MNQPPLKPPKLPAAVGAQDLDDPFGSVAPPPEEEYVIEDDDVEEIEVEFAPSVAPPPSVAGAPEAHVVLVVEDDPSIRAMIVRALGLTYTVYEAEDGVAAAALLTKIPNPHAMICDVMMPRMDGLTLAKSLKKNPQLRSIPIVFLTAKDHALDVVQGINAGARHYIAKPFKMKDLLEKVASVVGKQSAQWQTKR